MGLVEQMEDESDCIETFYKEYVECRSEIKIFLFFEGKDDYNYYWCRLSPFIGSHDYKKIDCNGKKKVIELYQMIEKKSSKINDEIKLFFVDRDFDSTITLPNDIYVTPSYSIENFYVSDSAFRNLLTGVWGLSGKLSPEDESDFEKALNYLIEKRDEIINSMSYTNAWYSLQRKRTRREEPVPKLSEIKEFDKIKNITNKSDLEDRVPNYIDVTEEEIQEELSCLMQAPVQNLRGKYFEQTIPKHIMYIFRESNKKRGTGIFLKKHKVNFQVCEGSMVTVLCGYADVPQCLAKYISSRLGILVAS